jgi:hypothetical protein
VGVGVVVPVAVEPVVAVAGSVGVGIGVGATVVVLSVGDSRSGATVVGAAFFLGAGLVTFALVFAFVRLATLDLDLDFVVFRVAAYDGTDADAMVTKQSATAIMRELRRIFTPRRYAPPGEYLVSAPPVVSDFGGVDPRRRPTSSVNCR